MKTENELNLEKIENDIWYYNDKIKLLNSILSKDSNNEYWSKQRKYFENKIKNLLNEKYELDELIEEEKKNKPFTKKTIIDNIFDKITEDSSIEFFFINSDTGEHRTLIVLEDSIFKIQESKNSDKWYRESTPDKQSLLFTIQYCLESKNLQSFNVIYK